MRRARFFSFALIGAWLNIDVSIPSTIRIPTAKLTLGSTADEQLRAAADCNRMSGAGVCSPEDFSNESLRTTHVASFEIDRTEVSQAAYARCVAARKCATIPKSRLDLPATHVDYRNANAFCSFVGKRLPTEEQFELAARGSGRRIYPWGSLFHSGRVNRGGLEPERTHSADGYEGLAPVTAFASGQTPLGVLQLAGNATEWTRSPDASRPGHRIARGGDYTSPPWLLRSAARTSYSETTSLPTLGFRCVRE